MLLVFEFASLPPHNAKCVGKTQVKSVKKLLGFIQQMKPVILARSVAFATATSLVAGFLL